MGSEFTLDIPIQYEAINNTEEVNPNNDYKYEIKKKLKTFDNVLSSKTILLVEDNESAVIQVKDLIENLGCKVMVARDANEAFVIIEQEITDAMILDLMMPGIDGYEVLKEIRTIEVRDGPVILDMEPGQELAIEAKQ